MSKLSTLFCTIRKPKQLIVAVLRNQSMFIPSKLYLKMIYRLVMDKKLDLKNPKAFSEKIQWLKLYGRNQEYTRMVDKIEAKKYIANIIGDEYVIPTISVWDKFEDIDFDKLPEQFVIKTSHDQGGVIVCQNKRGFNIDKARGIINRHLHRTGNKIYFVTREWPYRGLKPRILIEKYLVDESGMELKDYKVFCCNGIPKIVKVNYDHHISYKCNWYTTDWKYIYGTTIFDPTDPNRNIEKPRQLGKMLELASKLSKDFPFLRVDFYSIIDKLYLGELTFSPGSGFEKFVPESFDYEIGSWIKLPKKDNMQ